MKSKFKIFLEEVFGLTAMNGNNDSLLNPVLQVLFDIRKEAKQNKDFVTSDKIRNQLAGLGINIKDEKDGNTSWTMN